MDKTADQYREELPQVRRFPSWLYRLWLACGSPAPGVSRYLRYRVAGRFWPTLHDARQFRLRSLVNGPLPADNRVAVVIPCHNYGRFLTEAIDSVLCQTHLPVEIVVVDDASTDDTAEVAAGYVGRGVRYLRGDWKSVAAARNAGARVTSAPLLVFLDADDRLPPDYLKVCIKTMRDPLVAIAYGDMREFGDGREHHSMPAYDHALLQRRNYISSHAMIRRVAFETVGGYRELHNAHQDWDIYRRILAYPWTAAKARTHVDYRIHPDSMLRQQKKEVGNYPHRAGLRHEPVTIFTPFAGRRATFDKYLAALQSLECDPSQVTLHWYDTSGDEAFGAMLTSAQATLPFKNTVYTRAPLPELWGHTPQSLIENRVSGERNARHYYQMVVIAAYNEMLRTCSTDYVLTLEDDIILPESALQMLFDTFTEDAAAVVAAYPCRFRNCMIVWNYDDKGQRVQVPSRRSGTEPVHGSGFGCSLFRTAALGRAPIHYLYDGPGGWYDDVAFHYVRQSGDVLCNWDVEVEHLES